MSDLDFALVLMSAGVFSVECCEVLSDTSNDEIFVIEKRSDHDVRCAHRMRRVVGTLASLCAYRIKRTIFTFLSTTPKIFCSFYSLLKYTYEP